MHILFITIFLGCIVAEILRVSVPGHCATVSVFGYFPLHVSNE